MLKQLLAAATAAFLLAGALAFGAAKEASYNEQLMELDYHIFHISSINVINGLNLSRAQITELREMAREVEKAGGYMAPMTEPLPGELAEVRHAYVELASVLTRNGEISEELTRRVMAARTVESRAIRDSISEAPTSRDTGPCLRCHLSPARTAQLREARTRGGAWDESALSGQGLYSTPKAKYETYIAHLEGMLGKRGTAKVTELAPRVDAILSDAQKQVLADFSCCLIPPKNLSDPVRVGQAEVSDRKLQLLRFVREVPEARWPAARETLISRLSEAQLVKSTGTTEAQMAALHEYLGQVLDKTRRMSDTGFEMKKNSLCAELNPSSRPQTQNPRHESFKRAFFLTMPGGVKTYDAVLSRTAQPTR